MDKISKLDSQVIRGLLVAIVGLVGSILSAFGVDSALFSERAGPIIDALCTLITALGTGWAMYARLFLPTPPITDSAAVKTEERLRQGGFARPGLLSALFTTLVVVLALSACSPTQVKPTAVLSIACAPSDQYQVERCAEAVGDVYAVYLARLNYIVRDPETPADVKRQLQRLDRELTPAVRTLVQTAAAFVRLREASGPPEKVAAAQARLRNELAAVEPKVRSLPQL